MSSRPKKARLAKPSDHEIAEKSTDWSICALCQEKKQGEKLLNPTPQGYESLSTNLAMLKELDALPSGINISRLLFNEDLKEILTLNNAKWHKFCYKRCSSLKIERAQHRRQKEHKQNIPSPTKHHLRARTSSCSVEKDEVSQPACFFCDDVTGELHKAATHNLDCRVRSSAEQLGDSKILAKLAAGDMVAIDAVYHLNCLNSFYNKSRTRKRKSTDVHEEISNNHSLAFAEVVSYIEEAIQSAHDEKVVFKLSDLKQLYNERLENFGEDSVVSLHSSRFTKRLLHYLPCLEAHDSKAGTLLLLKQDTGNTLLDAINMQSDDAAILLMRVSKLIRKEMFEYEYSFKNSLTDEHYERLPVYLETLVKMILGDPTIKSPDCASAVSRAASSITQLVVFNSVKQGRTDTVSLHHNPSRETALPL